MIQDAFRSYDQFWWGYYKEGNTAPFTDRRGNTIEADAHVWDAGNPLDFTPSFTIVLKRAAGEHGLTNQPTKVNTNTVCEAGDLWYIMCLCTTTTLCRALSDCNSPALFGRYKNLSLVNSYSKLAKEARHNILIGHFICHYFFKSGFSSFLFECKERRFKVFNL